MLGKIFWGMVILLFIAILVIPFILPSYYAGQAEAQYENTSYEGDFDGGDDGDDIDIDFKKSRKKYPSRSVRSSGGSRSYRSGK